MIAESKAKSTEDTEIHNLVEHYWRRFISSIKLPSARVIPCETEIRDEGREQAWNATLDSLKQSGIESELLECLIEDEIPNPESRKLVKLLMSTSNLLAMSTITDKTLHDTYRALVSRLKEFSHEYRMTGFGSILEVEGYKLDEAIVIDSMKVDLGRDKEFLRRFFDIQGKRLPKLLTKALRVLGPLEQEE